MTRHSLSQSERDKAFSEAYKRDRRLRIAAMWRRFCLVAVAAGMEVKHINSIDSQLNRMWKAVRRRELDFAPRNVLEAVDLGVDTRKRPFVPKPCEPSPVLPGISKLPLFAERVEAGVELFHELDGELSLR